jgi:PhzF family phenazine biosynthesis protein
MAQSTYTNQVFQVDAFTNTPFKGNPAAVCMMPTNLPDRIYLSISREMNLSETAFVEKVDDHFNLRWFTPVREVPLCGHATLATAHVLFNHFGYPDQRIVFKTQSGDLYAEKTQNGIQLDFPRNDPHRVNPPIEAIKALGIRDYVDTLYSDSNQKLLIHLKDERDIRSLQPDFQSFLRADNPLGWRGAIVTARSVDYDFVSRYFAPFMGVDEDPVTGSAHTVLGPYWSGLLGKSKMKAYQASSRGGVVSVELVMDRVLLVGDCVTVVKGVIQF